jgi:hypothetical protein
MDKSHFMAFAKAMSQGDLDAAFEHVSDQVALRSPIFEEPFVGKAEVRRTMVAVRSVVEMERTGVAEGEDRIVSFNTLKMEGLVFEGMDLIQVDQDGLIDRITIMWRPLGAVLKGQSLLAPLLGREPKT